MAERRQGERIVHEAVPVKLEWISGDPPPAEKTRAAGMSMQHEVIAAQLRAHPGRWAKLPDLNFGSAGDIKYGRLAAYRPSGSFEAVIRRGAVYARHVGEDGEDETACVKSPAG
jgi:hypothetical protein